VTRVWRLTCLLAAFGGLTVACATGGTTVEFTDRPPPTLEGGELLTEAAVGVTTTPPPNTTASQPRTTSVPADGADTPPLTGTTAPGAGQPEKESPSPSDSEIADPPTTIVIPDPARIMPFGDSITEKPEYRLPLAQQLLDEGCLVDMLGSMVDPGFVQIGPWLDPHHEGHAGLRADQLADNTAAWAQAARPDLVLLYAGINDLYAGQDVASTLEDLQRIIDNLRSVNQNVTVLIAQILPGVGVEAEVAALNQGIATMRQRLDVAEARVFLVDLASGIDPATETWDGVHPNRAGGQKMATRWYRVLRPLIEPQCSF